MEIEKIRQASVLLEELDHLQKILKREQEEKHISPFNQHVVFKMEVSKSGIIYDLPSHFNDAILELINTRVNVLETEIENL
jgi:hypothetical protein